MEEREDKHTPDRLATEALKGPANPDTSNNTESVTYSEKADSSKAPTEDAAVKTKKKKKVSIKKETQECPIFLRKTYHMIDTCDPKIASWSEDGETFVVKDTDVFEKLIIPQFFKHSKFSSFVRQLNFYGFRKIKYADTIKIDPKLEAETANFWRFRNDNFKRGRPDLLLQISRSNGQQQTTTSEIPPEKEEDVKSLKTEVSSLKERIASLTKNIDDLTTLVQNMNVTEKFGETSEENYTGSKRKKLDVSGVVAEEIVSSSEMVTSQDLVFAPGTLLPAKVTSREQSLTSSLSDQEFVDELFTAFADDDMDCMVDDEIMPMTTSLDPPSPAAIDESSVSENNRPDPQLMKKLSDALALLPSDMQEMLVNRLIAAITNTESVKSHLEAVSALASASSLSGATKIENEDKPHDTRSSSCRGSGREEERQPHLPLAAATLGILLAQYGSSIKNKNCLTKSLPVIPVHA